MRKELKPNFEKTIDLFLKIDKLIKEYYKHWNNNEFNKDIEYNNLENKIYEITGKYISQYISFRGQYEEKFPPDEKMRWIMCIPEPNIVNDFTRKELTEIVKRLNYPFRFINSFQFLNINPLKFIFQKYIFIKLNLYFNDRLSYGLLYLYYYNKLLMANFKTFKHEYLKKQFINRKVKKYNVDEIVGKIWGSDEASVTTP